MRETDNFLRFDDSQKHALDGNRNLAVRAGAGSGKTSVLVERIVQLLARSWDRGAPLELSAIVAVTFTRKAAGELQDRLRRSFEQMAAQASGPKEADFWRARALELPRAVIGTIDRFCAGVLREFAYADEATPPLDPDFAPLQDFDEDELKREAAEQVVNRLTDPDRRQESPALRAEAEACHWWVEEEGYEVLIEHLTTLLDSLVDPEIIASAHEGLPPAVQRVEAAWANVPAVVELRRDPAGLIGSLQRLRAAIESSSRATSGLETLDAELGKTLRLLADRKEREALHSLDKAILTKGDRPRAKGLNAVAEQLEPLQETWAPLLNDFDFDFDGELRGLEAAERLVQLLPLVNREYLRLCHEHKQYDFLTLERRTRDLLQRSKAVRHELRSRFRHVLVDEFHDTNPLQWQIIEALVQGDAGLLEPDRLFVVGDPQQSIYRFRHADVGVFQRVQELIEKSNLHHGRESVPTEYDVHSGAPCSTLEQRRGLMPLAANYRALNPLPLGLLNRIFGHVFDSAHGRSSTRFEVDFQPLQAGRPEGGPTGEVSYLVVDEDEADASDDEETDSDLGPAQVRALVAELRALHGQPKLTGKPSQLLTWGDMAVLLPSRTEVLTALEREFRRRGVPYVVTKGIGFWQRQEVRDLVNLASWLGDPGNELALFGVLRGPLGQCTDTDVLFLAQLGGGSLGRGLEFFDARRGDVESLLTSSGAEQWESLPEPVRAGLSAYWSEAPNEARRALVETADRLRLWRQRVDRVGHAELMQKALEESGAYALYAADDDGTMILANLRRLFERIRDWEATTGSGLSRLARRLRALVEGSLHEEQAPLTQAPDAVQVMTVHAAKGLEFSVVAIPKLERQVGRPTTHRLLVKTEWHELLAEDSTQFFDVRPGTVTVAVRHPRRPREVYAPRLLRALRRLETAQDLAESRRLFYVAATRAEERLILAGRQLLLKKNGQPRQSQHSWQKWFEEALRLSDAHMRQAWWEEGGLRVRIVTTVPDEVAGPTQDASILDVPFDLEPIVETAPIPLISIDQLLDRQARLESVMARMLGALVQRGFRLASPPPLSDLRAMAHHLLNAHGEADAGIESIPCEPVAEEAQRLLVKIRGARPGLDRIRALFAADGPEEVPCVFRLGETAIHGMFDKVVQGQSGTELLVWSAEDKQQSLFRLKLLALASVRGQHAAAGCLRAIYFPSLGERIVTFAESDLSEFEESLRRRLETVG